MNFQKQLLVLRAAAVQETLTIVNIEPATCGPGRGRFGTGVVVGSHLLWKKGRLGPLLTRSLAVSVCTCVIHNGDLYAPANVSTCATYGPCTQAYI